MKATVEQSEIRGLVTAGHFFVAELPLSRIGNSVTWTLSRSAFEGSPDRGRAPGREQARNLDCAKSASVIF
jgi:hypothetical protein